MFQEDNNQKTLKVALYVRVSTDEQVERYGISLQKESLEGLIKSKGQLPNGQPVWKLAGEKYIYVEEGMSGSSDINVRPAFIRLKEDLIMAPEDNKPFDIVAVYKIDRFARSLKVLLEIIDLFENNNIKFVSANENIDTSSPFGKAILGIIGIIAELELQTIKNRTDDGRRQAIKNGIAMGSAAPFGYCKDENKRLKILKVEADVVKEIFRLFTEEKLSTYFIGKHLEEKKIFIPEISSIVNKKRKGEAKNVRTSSFFWRANQVRNILKNEVYIGKYYYAKRKNNKVLDKSLWQLAEHYSPAIIDNATFYKAEKILDETRFENIESPSKHIYLLSGLLKCDHCYDQIKDYSRIIWTGNRKEIEKGEGKFTYSYRCSRKTTAKYATSCSTIPLPAKQLEDYIVDFIKELLKNPVETYEYQIKLKSTRAELKHLKLKRDELQDLTNALPSRKNRLLEQHEIGAIKMNVLKEALDSILEKEKEYRIKLDAIDNQIAQNTFSKGYQESLELFSKKYLDMLDSLNTEEKNRPDIYTIIHKLIEEIVVVSRPIKDGDVVSGKKKKDQAVPCRLHIKLKLPQTILQELTLPVRSKDITQEVALPVRSEKIPIVGSRGFEPLTPSV